MQTITIENAQRITLSLGNHTDQASVIGQLLNIANPTTTAPTPPNAGEVWPGQGGIYLCTMGPQGDLPARHLILSPERADDLQWGPRDHDVPGAKSQYDGAANTAALMTSPLEFPAAEWAAGVRTDGHTDFFLPSRLDLLMAYINAPQLFEKDGWYWSSTQDSAHNAYCQHFSNGNSYWYGKGSAFRAVALRQIPLSHFNA